MYGWRGRMGLMLPYDNRVIEPEFARWMPVGVSAHSIRTTKTDRKELALESLDMAAAFANLDVDVALYACSASGFMQGKQWHDDFLARFEEAAGVRTITAASAMIDEIRDRGVASVTLVTPYPEWLLEPLERFVVDNGLGVAAVVGLGLEPRQINDLSPSDSYRLAVRSDVPDSDGVFILATNFRTLEILESLERDLGKPVMSSNQALMWIALRMLGIKQEESHVRDNSRIDLPGLSSAA